MAIKKKMLGTKKLLKKAQAGTAVGTKTMTPNPNTYVSRDSAGGGYQQISPKAYVNAKDKSGMQELTPAQYTQSASRIRPMQKGGVTWTDNGQGVTKTKDTRKGGTKDKSFTTVNGYAGSSSRVTNTKRDAEGTVLKEKTKSISPKRVERVENRTESKMTYKTGGMVNANTKISAAKTATGKVGGVTKAISKVAVKSAAPKGRVGGISKAPKKALPKAQMGAVVKTPPTPGGTPKAGGAILKDTSNKRIPKSFINSGKPKAGGAILKDTSKAKMGGSMKKKSC